MALEASHTETIDSTECQSHEAESSTPVHADDPLAEVRPITPLASNERKSLPNEPTCTMEAVESQELGYGFPQQRDTVLSRVAGLNWTFNPIELLPLKYRRGGPEAPEGTKWVITNRGMKEPGIFLYEESALWLVDKHRQSRAEAEVSELGGWGMQAAGPLRDWDLWVGVDDEEDYEEWFQPGEPYEEWIEVRPAPNPESHFPGKGKAAVPSLSPVKEDW